MSTDFSTSRCVRAIVFSEPLGLTRASLGQGRQMDIDAHQGLGDFIMQLAADALSFFLLRLQNLMGQMPQLFLHVARLLQQLALVLLAFLEGFLHRLPPDNFPLATPGSQPPEPPGGVAPPPPA